MNKTMTYNPPQSFEEYRRRARETPFPPTRWEHIESYRHALVMDGYRARRNDAPQPDDQWESSFRWGWAIADREITGKDDGFGDIRAQHAEYMRQKCEAADA